MSRSIDTETAADAAIYQHPLAYLLGLQGVALFRAFAGEYDRDFTNARLAKICTLLDSADQLGEGGYAVPITTADGYDGWAPYYDQPGNAMIDREQPIVREILDGLPVGVALDAACGTGRHTAYASGTGQQRRLPRQASLHRLALPTRWLLIGQSAASGLVARLLYFAGSPAPQCVILLHSLATERVQ
jgi:hypothetical protein